MTNFFKINLFLFIYVLLIITFFIFSKRRFITNLIIKELLLIPLSSIRTSVYSPLIISLIIFIVFSNLTGLIPYIFFFHTSQPLYTLTLSSVVMMSVTLIGLNKKNIHFFKIFLPEGLSSGPARFVIPLVVVIEIISYFSRVISLAARLSINMTAGHILINIIKYGITIVLGLNPYFVFTPLLLTILSVFIILEFGICIIQGYIFGILTITYLKDALLSH